MLDMSKVYELQFGQAAQFISDRPEIVQTTSLYLQRLAYSTYKK